MSRFKIGGWFVVEQWRHGKLIKKHRIKNGITTGGLNDLLGVAFRNQTQHAAWYFGLIDGASPPTLSAGDIMSSHSGWTENVDYSDASRLVWTPVTSGDAKIINTSYPTFNINATITVAGCFITSDNTKSGTSGILWSTGLFANGNVSLESGDALKTYYELTAAGA
jgi:hypothetical protein